MKLSLRVLPLILFAILSLGIFYFQFQHRNKELRAQRWYATNTKYNFCCKVVTLKEINSRGGLGVVGCNLLSGESIQYGLRVEDSLQKHLPMFKSMRFLIEERDYKFSDVRFTVPSISDISIGDTVCVNSSQNSISRKSHGDNERIGEMTLCLEIDGGIPF